MRTRVLALIAAAAFVPAAVAQTFTNPESIAIPLIGQASTYPTTIEVTGMNSPISSVAVVLNGFSHSYAGDVDILLVGPNGKGAYILSDAGASAHFDGGMFGFVVGGAALTSTNNSISTGLYEPTFTAGDDTFPSATFTWAASLNEFNGINANGTWKLYIVDDANGDSGVISGGWSLVFNSPAPTSTPPNTFTYQGRLEGATGPVDLKFQLDNSAWFPESLSATDWQYTALNVVPDAQGLFTVEVPYSWMFMDGSKRFLDVQVSPAGQNQYTKLTPRQPITMAPMAEWARQASRVPWDGVVGVPAGIADGIDDAGPWAVVDGDVQYNGGGNVGIGATMTHAFNVTSPTMYNTRLHSTASVGTALEVTNSNTPQGGLFMISNAPGTGGIGNLVIRNENISYSYTGIIITPANYVGIGTTSPDFTLTVSGSAGKPGGGSWAVWSDARLKHDITPLTGTLDKLLNVHGVSYFYNEPEKIGELKGRQTGVVAQEVEKVFPEWVEEGASGYKSVTFRGFEAMTIEALRDLRNEKDAQIKALRDENAELKSRLERLEKAMAK